ncbi:MAG: MGMT family protein [Deltaproteobacteria bacterium]|nr:MGMT family protein [Deltaproteobacteria bacterium]
MSKKSFDQKCYELLRQIPKGKVTTYALIARKLRSKAYRAVGNAMNRNPNAPAVPCHRVVRSSGEIGGYALGTAKKVEMLKQEGIPIGRGAVIDLKRYLYQFK